MTAPILHHYNPNNGEYVRSAPARHDPLEQDRYLHPKNTTTTAPPSVSAGEVAVFSNESWSKVYDRRGTKYYDIDGFGYEHNNLSDIPSWAISSYPQETDETANTVRLYNPETGEGKSIHFLPPSNWLSANNWHQIQNTTPPDVQDNQTFEEDGYENVNGTWQIKWAVRNKSTAVWNAQKMSEISRYTAQKMDAGITVPGLGTIRTNESDRGMISGAALGAFIENDPTATLTFYPPGSAGVVITNEQIIAMGILVKRHVQKCLDAKAAAQSNVATYANLTDLRSAIDDYYENN
jgi:hypothetical protein